MNLSKLMILGLSLPTITFAETAPTKVVKVQCESKMPFGSFSLEAQVFGDFNSKGRFIPLRASESQENKAAIVVKDAQDKIIQEENYSADPAISEFIFSDKETLTPIVFKLIRRSGRPMPDYYPKQILVRYGLLPDPTAPEKWIQFSESRIYWVQNSPTYTSGRGQTPADCKSTLEDAG